MTAGLAWDEWRPIDPQNTFLQMMTSADAHQFVLDRPMSDEPGTRWNYNSGLPDLLASILYHAVGESLPTFAQKNLIEPLGMNAQIRSQNPGTLSAIAMTPRDLVKYGYLYLQNGLWNERQVISADWVQASTEPHAATPFDSGYGYYWWLPSYGGYAAEGDGGQRIIVIPEQDMVIVFTAGLTYPEMGTVPDKLVQDYILGAIRSSGPLSENQQANGQLAARLQAIAQPNPKPVAPLPVVAGEISGKTYTLEANSIGLEAFRLDFIDREAAINMSFAGQPQLMAVGLDNTYQITQLEPSGLIYGWMALRGTWLNEDHFALHLMMSGVARNLLFQFREGDVVVWYMGSRGEREPIPGTLR